MPASFSGSGAWKLVSVACSAPVLLAVADPGPDLGLRGTRGALDRAGGAETTPTGTSQPGLTPHPADWR